MWYKCLNPNCKFVFTRTGECDKCPDCGKQCLREVTSEERKPSLDEQIAIAKSKVKPTKESKNPEPEQREIGERKH